LSELTFPAVVRNDCLAQLGEERDVSVATAVTLALRRNDKTTSQSVTKADIGKGTTNQDASTLDILAAVVPTGMVAPYTGFLAVVAGLAAPTDANPTPDQEIGWRLILLIVLVVATIGYVLAKYSSEKDADDPFPWAVLLATTIAAAAWGLATPGSWLFATLEGNAKVIVPAGIGAGGALALAALTPLLRKGTQPPAG
jgi:hypothetical protein